VYSNAPTHFPKLMVEGKFFEAVEGAKELVEVKFSEDFLKFSKALEDPREPGTVPGAKEEPATTGQTENIPGAGTADTQVYDDAGSASTNQVFGSVRNLLAIQNQGFDRVHVGTNGARRYPWRMNGRLSMGCTAALIGNRVLLTAAHCVWDKETNSWASFPTFSAGQDGATRPYGSKQVWRMTIPAGYMSCSTNNDCRAHDWAVLVLREDQALNVGYFGFSNVKDGQLNLAGYPQSKNREMWYDHCPLFSDEGAWIKHRCDTEPGNSGSAIYKIKNGNRYVVAVHGGGYTGQWNRGADVNGRTSSAGRLYDRMLAERMRYG
jgi:V8-like Glu-specific endopeptidase